MRHSNDIAWPPLGMTKYSSFSNSTAVSQDKVDDLVNYNPVLGVLGKKYSILPSLFAARD